MTLAILIITGTAILAGSAVFYLFFSPWRLGPAPAKLLKEDFFLRPGDISGVRLHVGGEEAFGAILAVMESAVKSIHIQTFIWKDDALGRLLAQSALTAADRGAQVCLCKDLLGSFFELAFKGGKPSPLFNDARLKSHPRVKVAISPWKPVDHSKYYVVDDKSAFFGGMNVADEYHKSWRDYMVELNGETLARDFYHKTAEGGDWPEAAPFVIAANSSRAAQIRTGILEVIGSARERLVFQHAYFSSSAVIAAMEGALARGARVDLILPENPATHGPANRAAVNRLLAFPSHGLLRVFFYPKMSHAKALIADGKIVVIGSANLTPRSLYVSGETAMFAHFPKDHPFILRLAAQMEKDMAESRIIAEPIPLSPMERARALAGKYIW